MARLREERAPTVFGISGHHRDEICELLLLGRRTASARVLQLLAGEEVEPALRGNLILIDPEGGAERPLVGGYRVARRFQQLVLEHLDAVESIALRAGARFVRERSERPFEAIARAMLG